MAKKRKKKKFREMAKNLPPIKQYELGLFYEDMADKLQIGEYRARYYAKARDIFKRLALMVKAEMVAQNGDETPPEDTLLDADPADEETPEALPVPESFTEDEDGPDIPNGFSAEEDEEEEDPQYIAEALDLDNLRMLRARTRKKVYEARALTIIEAYENAAALRDSAVTTAELRYAADQFDSAEAFRNRYRLLEMYMDPELYKKVMTCTDNIEQAKKLRSRAMKMERGNRFRFFTVAAAAIGLIAFLLYFSGTGTFYKLKGDVEMALGIPEKAWQAYGSALKDHGREDLEEVYKNARRTAGVKAYGEGNWKEARDVLREPALASDQEADRMYTDAERALIRTIKAGQNVRFAGTDWTVLENDGASALLLRLENIPEVPFSADGSACTWADSSLRAYLNEDYIREKFTPGEAALLLQTELSEEANADGSIVNPASADTVYIFSIAEFEKYKDLFPKWEKDTWLRTPGDHEGTEAFAGMDNAVMPHGYDVGAEHFRVKPVIRVDLS